MQRGQRHRTDHGKRRQASPRGRAQQRPRPGRSVRPQPVQPLYPAQSSHRTHLHRRLLVRKRSKGQHAQPIKHIMIEIFIVKTFIRPINYLYNSVDTDLLKFVLDI